MQRAPTRAPRGATEDVFDADGDIVNVDKDNDDNEAGATVSKSYNPFHILLTVKSFQTNTARQNKHPNCHNSAKRRRLAG